MTKHPLQAWLLATLFVIAGSHGSICLAQMSESDKDSERIQKLVQSLGSEEYKVREEAQRQLVVAGKAALDTLRRASQNKDPEIRERAAVCITQIKHDMYVAEIIAQLQKGRPAQRVNAACVLINMGRPGAAAVPALLRAAIDDPDLQVRMCAMGALGQMGSAAKCAVPRLIAMIEDEKESHDVREVAISTLGDLGKTAADALPCLMKLAKGKNVEMVKMAAGNLGRVGKGDSTLVPVLLPLLKHENRYVRGSAAASLGEIGKQPSVVVPALVELLKREKPDPNKGDPRMPILWGLALFGPEAKPTIPVLLEIISNRNEDSLLQSRAIDVLVAIGPKAKVAVPTLLKLLDSPDDFKVHIYIEHALYAFQAQSK